MWTWLEASRYIPATRQSRHTSSYWKGNQDSSNLALTGHIQLIEGPHIDWGVDNGYKIISRYGRSIARVFLNLKLPPHQIQAN